MPSRPLPPHFPIRAGFDQKVELPVMLCTTACPGMPCPLHIYEPRYRFMVRRAIESGSRRFGIFTEGSGPHNLAKTLQLSTFISDTSSFSSELRLAPFFDPASSTRPHNQPIRALPARTRS
ncbi:unnamed protein product [Protopolystoma xenopodis]|uniref:Lon N-terminal domain-containing protein n=1 Tax=Protopolystoma xenopodis TaxID=117903 RepID=A0A448WIJ1_9PLAT|nr:unnamed protein product [Protopolystoma xenopodis]